MNIYEDYSVILSYVPLSHDKTTVELTWFVSGQIPKPAAAAVEK